MTTGPGVAAKAMARLRRHALILLVVVSLVLATAAVLAMRLGGIAGWDAAAHLYKITLLQEGESVFWDNNWYGGAYQIIGYGFIFYWLAQYVSYSLLVVVSTGALPVLFYLYMRRAYGVTSLLPALVLAAVLAVYLSNGQDPFLFGLAMMMGGLVLFSYRRAFLAALCMGPAAFANPLAVVIGGVFLVALVVSKGEMRRPAVRLAIYLIPFIALRVASTLLFWEPASYLYQPVEAMTYIAFGVVGALVARFSLDPERRAKETLFVTFVALVLLSSAVPGNPVGGNVGRFFLIFGVPLLLCVRDVAMPRSVTVPLLCAIAFGQLITPATHYVHIAKLPSTNEAFFAPALAFANLHRDPNYRSHVVALDTHWEAYYFSVDGYPITRGWYRQDDALHNDVLRRDDFATEEYTAWLREMAVRYVYLPEAPLDHSGKRETEILTTSPEFTVVASVPGWTIYELRNPGSMIEPLRRDGHAKMLLVEHQGIYVYVKRPGPYLIRVSYSPYWEVTNGVGFISAGEGGFLVLNARRTGFYGIRVRVTLESSWRQLVTAL